MMLAGSGSLSVVVMCLAAGVLLRVKVFDDGVWDGGVRFA